ncbi:MAG: tRNA (guanosine(37)-N1)-methyltransferase TrmD [Patescibacteria group bacterium]
MITFHIITLFPDSISCYIQHSIIKRAIQDKTISILFYNPMDYTTPRSKGALAQRVDDKPYGGGPGMVIRAEPIIKAVQDAIGRKRNVEYIHFAPRAHPYSNKDAQEIVDNAKSPKGAIRDIVIFCGRYEGIDSRIEEIYPGRKISIGEYVLTGGELPAMIVIDSVTRRIPGVLGDQESIEEQRIAPEAYYTRPQRLHHRGKNYDVPQVLVEGNHAEIEKWRKNKK